MKSPSPHVIENLPAFFFILLFHLLAFSFFVVVVVVVVLVKMIVKFGRKGIHFQ
jgi:hypothetical protein